MQTIRVRKAQSSRSYWAIYIHHGWPHTPVNAAATAVFRVYKTRAGALKRCDILNFRHRIKTGDMLQYFTIASYRTPKGRNCPEFSEDQWHLLINP